MAYDEGLADHVRLQLSRLELSPEEQLGETKMFGGLCFTLNKKMLVGVERSRLLVRMTDEDLAAAIASGQATPMDFTGKPLRNFGYLSEKAFELDSDLFGFIEKSAEYVRLHMLGKPQARKTKKKA